MVNFGLNSASILGIFLAVGGAGLYFLRSFRPELSRDHDIFFAAIGLLCGFILIFQGWRLDPILQFGQFLLATSVVFFAVETVRLRGATTEQARRTSPRSNDSDDDYRPVTNAYTYTAELDELEAVDDYPNNRRLRGTTRRNDDYDSEPPRRRANPPRSGVTPSSEGRSEGRSENRSKRPASRSERPDRSEKPEGRGRNNDWEAPPVRPSEDWDDSPSRRPSRRPRGESPVNDYDAPSTSWQEEEPEPRPRRRKPQSNEETRTNEDGRTPPRASRPVPPPEDYVDFQPVDSPPVSPTPEEEDEEQPRGSEY